MNFMWKNGPNINVGGHRKPALLAVFLSHKVNNKKPEMVWHASIHALTMLSKTGGGKLRGVSAME